MKSPISPKSPDPVGKATWDPVGFLVFLFLLVVFGGAILFLIRWVAGLVESFS